MPRSFNNLLKGGSNPEGGDPLDKPVFYYFICVQNVLRIALKVFRLDF